MDLELHNRVILVSGGARGIGGAIVAGLVGEGAIPFVIDRQSPDPQALAELQRLGRVETVVAELSQPVDCARAIETVLARCGRIDGLVNNAGRNDGVGLLNGDAAQFLRSLCDNLVHYYELARLCLPELKLRQGAIVNISSKVAETGQGGTSGYAAANGGRNALTREWASELAPWSVRVNAVIVSECWTPMYENWLATLSEAELRRRLPAGDLSELPALRAAVRQQIADRIPLGRRMTEPREIADSVLFLLSPRASHITGQWLHVDGGYVHLDRP